MSWAATAGRSKIKGVVESRIETVRGEKEETRRREYMKEMRVIGVHAKPRCPTQHEVNEFSVERSVVLRTCIEKITDMRGSSFKRSPYRTSLRRHLEL